MVRLLVLLVLSCLLILSFASSSDILNDNFKVNFGVGLTTIPPRYSSVHHVVRSWLQQDHPPSVVVVFLPNRYKMFSNGIGKRKNKNYLELESQLKQHFATEMEERRVVIQVVDKDMGPLTKYTGMMEFFSSFDENIDGSVIDQWVIGDDDVHYESSTLTAYSIALQEASASDSAPSVMTHFNVHARLQVLLDNEFYPIAHFQGVDTVMFPRSLIQQHSESSNGVFHLQNVLEVAEYYHKTCPESFFQDDYVISAMIFATQLPFRSVWNGSKVALHVDDVSTSFQQMHLNVNVFDREQATKQCVEDKMSQVLQIMHDDTEMHGMQYDLMADKLAHLDILHEFADESETA